MKQIKHTLHANDLGISWGDVQTMLPNIFEWANKMGREGKVLTGLDIDIKAITCVEFVTDDQYAEMLKNGTIVEHKEKDGLEDGMENEGAKEPSKAKEPEIQADTGADGDGDTRVEGS